MNRLTAAIVAGTAASAIVGLATLFRPAAVAGSLSRATRHEAVVGAGCDHDGVETAVRTAFEPAVGYTVVAVDVAGIDSACAGRHVSVAVTDRLGAISSESEPALVPPGGGTVTVPVPPVAVATAARVHTLLD